MTIGETIVAFRSAKERCFRGAKGDYLSVTPQVILIFFLIGSIANHRITAEYEFSSAERRFVRKYPDVVW
jgi:hypothetical protein